MKYLFLNFDFHSIDKTGKAFTVGNIRYSNSAIETRFDSVIPLYIHNTDSEERFVADCYWDAQQLLTNCLHYSRAGSQVPSVNTGSQYAD